MRLLLISFLIVGSICFGADRKYPVSEIPETLKKGMYAVIREEQNVFTIHDINKATHYVKRVVTILNKNGEDMASEAVFYDKLTRISFFRGTAYDADGNILKKLKAIDFYDRSYVSSGTLFDDNRIKSASLAQPTYPYTVEFEYETEDSYLYSLPRFYLYRDDEVSAQKRTFTIVYNKKYPPRYKTFQIADPKKTITSNGLEQLEWSFENIIPDKFEPYSPDLVRFVPNILAGPTEFEYSGYRGSMKSWADYCNWEKELMKGRDVLPEETRVKIIALTKDQPSVELKVRTLYEYLQSKTRYVNISLGIGGLQPFPASTVDQVGYGDCKALSNYMIAMLKVVGIEGIYTTIMAGDDAPDVDTEFPSHQGNHVIVAVPNQADTIWLECTSQTKAYGYMGGFTGGRKALLNTKSGGQWVNTPSYPTYVNRQTRTVTIGLEATGDATGQVRTTYSGLQYENGGLDFIVHMGSDKQKEWIQKNTNIPNFDLGNFTMTNNKSRLPSAVVRATFTLRKLATLNGKRLFLTPNIMNRSTNIPPKLDTRKTDVVLRTGYVDIDTVEYTLPENIYPEFIPDVISHRSRFGEYEAKFLMNQTKLLYIRRMQLNDGTYPPDAYNEYIEFRKNISKADNIKVVFVNKT